ncbi:MAG: energy transducer TonB, partial [Desulfovibrionaceae bacterium]
PPDYPASARRRGLTGVVELRFLVEPDGAVSEVEVVSARPEGIFEQAAIQAVRRWRFRPGLVQGRPVRTWMRIPITFQLR